MSLRSFFGTKESIKKSAGYLEDVKPSLQDEPTIKDIETIELDNLPAEQANPSIRKSSRMTTKKSYTPPSIGDIFNDEDLDADLMSIDTSHMLNDPDKEALKSIIEQKSKLRILNDELEVLQQRTASTDALKSFPSKRTVASDDEFEAHERSSHSSNNPSDDQNELLEIVKPFHHASSKKPKPVSFFTEGVPKIETTSVEAILVGEKKAFNYFQLLSKQASNCARHPGVSIEGKENCLLGLTFVFTGNFAQLNREEIQDLSKRYGGKVTSAPSGKTSFIVVGDDPGPGKIEKAKQLGLSLLNEEQFYKLIQTMPRRSEHGEVIEDDHVAMCAKKEPPKQRSAPVQKGAPDACLDSLMWTFKYMPKDLSELVGNNSQVQKLRQWLQEWKRKGPMGATFKAALISGPPGIGKTTAANLVAKIEGYMAVELNASDTRSKKSLKNEVQDLLDNKTMITNTTSFGSKTPFKSILLIMDEVDGMSAGDRGGMAELIVLLKKTKIPVICICNDRSSIKVRSLANYCLDIRFRRPDSRQIAPRISEICRKQNLPISANIVDQLVSSTHGDMRQILNILSTWLLTKDSLSYDEAKSYSELSKKDTEKGPFDVIGELMSRSSFSSKSINQLLELYFTDSSLVPLMMQENYVACKPTLPHAKSQKQADFLTLQKISAAADSFSLSDIVDARIHGANQLWTLAPFHGFLSCVVPAFNCSGSLGGRIEFASWLGQNSKCTKNNRLLTELSIHLCLHVTGGKSEIRQAYLPAFVFLMASTLIQKGVNGVGDVIAYLDRYTISKEDYDAIMELGVGKYDASIISNNIPSNVKSTLTRQYNKEFHQMPYALTDVKKNAALSASTVQMDAISTEDVHISEDDEEIKEVSNDLVKDKMIKPKASKGKGVSAAKSRAAKTIKPKRATKPPQNASDSYDEGDGFIVSDDD
ncbi:DNA replication factor C complex subunit Rfc1 [Mitosporidium daphniae]